MKMRRIIRIACLVALLFCSVQSKAQFYSVRTNMLGWLTASPNVGFGIAVSRKTSFDFELMGGFLKLPQFSTQAIMAQEGMRFWFLEVNAGSFLGFHFTQALYDVGNAKYLYRGQAYGVGLSYGHSWYVAKRWNIGIEIGASVMYMDDAQSERKLDYTQNTFVKNSQRIMVLPTKFAVTVVYLF